MSCPDGMAGIDRLEMAPHCAVHNWMRAHHTYAKYEEMRDAGAVPY
jgi:hypothetical protein